jgi:hypothetical protein
MMGVQSHPVATYRGMFIHHLFLDALHTTSQTVSRQEETFTATVTRPLQDDVSVHGQQSGRPGRQYRARVGHLRSLRHQLFVNDQGKGTAPTEASPAVPVQATSTLPRTEEAGSNQHMSRSSASNCSQYGAQFLYIYSSLVVTC